MKYRRPEIRPKSQVENIAFAIAVTMGKDTCSQMRGRQCTVSWWQMEAADKSFSPTPCSCPPAPALAVGVIQVYSTPALYTCPQLTPAIICCRSWSDPRFAFLPDDMPCFGQNHSTHTFWGSFGRSIWSSSLFSPCLLTSMIFITFVTVIKMSVGKRMAANWSGQSRPFEFIHCLPFCAFPLVLCIWNIYFYLNAYDRKILFNDDIFHSTLAADIVITLVTTLLSFQI